MSGFFRKIFTESKQEQKPDEKKSTPTKMQQQSMYEFNVGGDSEKVVQPNLFKSSEAEQPASQPTSQASKSQIKEKPSMFSKMKVKNKDEKKTEYEPITIPQPTQARRYTQSSEKQSRPVREPEEVKHVKTIESQNEPDVDDASNRQVETQIPTYAPLAEYKPMADESEEQKEGNTDASLQKRIAPTSSVSKSQPIRSSQSYTEKETLVKKQSQVSTISVKQPVKQIIEQKEPYSSSSTRPKKESTIKKQSKEEIKPIIKKNEVQQIQEEILASKQQLFDIIKKQKTFKSTIIENSQQLEVLKTDQIQTVKQQNQAIEHEQFLLADTLESKLATIASQISNFESELAHLQLQYENSEREMMQYYTKENDHRKHHILRLKSVRDEANSNLAQQEKAQNEWLESSKARIERQRKKLSILENEIKFNEEKIEEIEHQYNEDLSNQTRKQLQQRDELVDKRQLLIIQIEDMERRLQAKRQELLELSDSVTKADDEIESIKRGFETEYKKIVVRKEKLKDMEVERKDQILAVAQLQKVTDERFKQGSAQVQVLAANIRYIDEQTQCFGQEGVRFEERLRLRTQRFSDFLEKSAQLKEYEQLTRGKKQKIKEIQFKKSGLAVELANLESRRKEIRDKIPILESEKLVMINSKNFKGAASKAAELKDANEKQLDVSSKMESAFIEDKMLEQELNAALENNQSSQDEQQALRTQLAISQYKFEELKLEDLENEKKTVSRCNVASKAQKLLFIENQISNLREEVNFLRSEYGIGDAQQSPIVRKQSEEVSKPTETVVEVHRQDEDLQREKDQPHQESAPSEMEKEDQGAAEESKDSHIDEEHIEEHEATYKPFVEEEDTSYVPLSE